MSWQYRPGTWVAVARAGCVVVVEDRAVALDVWDALAAADPVAEVLDVFVRAGLRRAPQFAIWERSSAQQRLLVRGSVVTKLAHGRTIDGSRAITWSENDLSADEDLQLEMGAEQVPDVQWWVLVEGMAPASAVRSGHPAPSQGDDTATGAGAPAPDMAAPVVAAPAPPEAAVPTPPVVAPALLVVPPASASASATVPLPESEDPPEPYVSPYDHHFEATTFRPVQDSAVREVPEPDLTAEPDAPEEPEEPDAAAVGSDGTPVAGATDLTAAWDDAADDDDLGITVMRVSNADAGPHGLIDSVPSAGSGPEGVLALATPSGEDVPLDRVVLVGRAPAVEKVSGVDLPHLVVLPDPTRQISATHLRLEPRGRAVLATDTSTNGTRFTRPGSPQSLMPQGVPVEVGIGTSFDLGSQVVVRLVAAGGP